MSLAGNEHTAENTGLHSLHTEDADYFQQDKIFDDAVSSVFTYEWKVREVGGPPSPAPGAMMPISWSPFVRTSSQGFNFVWKIFYHYVNDPECEDMLTLTLIQCEYKDEDIEVRLRTHVTYQFLNDEIHSEYYYQKLDVGLPLGKCNYSVMLDTVGYHDAKSITVHFEFGVTEQMVIDI